ncbi:cysteine synthase family protein [Zoogloea sp.]|uniref:PLP-dependent cysteine synthase family protein n=1 Tax=Zoogloea sp. TaxID=49181 RepID=UPI001AD37B77|nr:cysteine synthase family protein [Zoogloea sp.]MBN8283083.1 cysteine synthase family protein [Zoogloea sp.]
MITPVMRISTSIYAKLENLQLGGSHKARSARQIMIDAIRDGDLTPGMTVLERSGGNLGIGLAIEANRRGYPLHLVVNLNFSQHKRKILKALGAELVGLEFLRRGLTTLDTVQEVLARQERPYFFPDQFRNPANLAAHALHTAPEILNFLESIACSFDDQIVFVGGIGTGASITAIGRAMKATFPATEVVAVQPENVDFQNHSYGPHSIQGTGVARPPLFDSSIVDRYVPCSHEQMLSAQQWLIRTQGLFVGYSSAANAHVARILEDEWTGRRQRRGRRLVIVTLIYDCGSSYMGSS